MAIWTYLPPCKEMVKIISASLDRKLTFRERVILKIHLWACQPCVRYFEQSQILQNAASHLDDELKNELFSGRLSDEARNRIKDIMRASTGLFAFLIVPF